MWIEGGTIYKWQLGFEQIYGWQCVGKSGSLDHTLLSSVAFVWLDMYHMIEQMLFISIHHIHGGFSAQLCMVGFINSCSFRIGKYKLYQIFLL